MPSAEFFKSLGGILGDAENRFQLTEEVDAQFDLVKNAYSESEGDDPQAIIENVGKAPGMNSLFNPFNIFRYSKFGLNTESYNRKLHFDYQDNGGGVLSNLQGDAADQALSGISYKTFETLPEPLKKIALSNQTRFDIFKDVQKTIENPTASSIIKWSRTQGASTAAGNGAVITPTPYNANDFLWCKYYGKVPNNRLVTLRRYPIPVEDNLLIQDKKSPLVPIAQAVTWFGKDIGNPLSSILNLSWGLNWVPRTAEVQDITGNEITVDQLAATAGIKDEKVIAVLKQIFTSSDQVDILKLAGYDTSIQEYIKEAYGANGPYWNRILGPINVIDRTKIRDRGFKDQKNIKLAFEYSLRGYSGINPKLAFLDLLSNFLSLTYNTAPFWGGGARYFQKTGVTIPALGMEQKMLEGDFLGGLQLGVEQLQRMAEANIKDIINTAYSLVGASEKNIEAAREEIDARIERGENLTDEDIQNINKFNSGTNENQTISKLLAPRLGQLMMKPLIYRSILDGRAVGEWHITVGNPMNPMAVIGNLCLEGVEMEVGEVLGIDDFPTEFKFTVTLSHGRPRAKQDLESIFNLGNGAMTFSELPQPSSASNSYGKRTSDQLNNVLPSDSGIDPTDPGASGNVNVTSGDNEVPVQNNPDPNTNPESNADFENNLLRYRSRVSQHYGQAFGNSPILRDYFKELKTKD
jgi:hypothetical protein